jgi:hypothetical protein
MKSRKIAISGPILRFWQNEALKQNPPLLDSCQMPIGLFLHSHGLTWLSSLCSFQLRRKTLSQITIHKYSFQFQQNKSLIRRRQRSILHPPQKRPLRKLLPLIYTQKRKKEKDRERLAEREGLDEFTEIGGFEDWRFKMRVEPAEREFGAAGSHWLE